MEQFKTKLNHKNFDLKLETNKKNHEPTNFWHALQITGYVCITEVKNAKRILTNRRAIAKKENIWSQNVEIQLHKKISKGSTYWFENRY